MTHVMLDLETFGTRPGSVIRSIGAVVFDPRGGSIGDAFYRNISDESCLQHGMTKDQSTVEWWSKQSSEAQESLLKDQIEFSGAADDFHTWFKRASGEMVWSQGSNFDVVLWEASCLLAARPVPWKFYNTRDTRTVYDICGLNVFKIKREGTYHNALDDAIHQARLVQRAVGMMRSVS